MFGRSGHPSMALGRVYTGKDAPSRRQPAPQMAAYLAEHAGRICYLCLHGYLAVEGVEYIIRQMLQLATNAHSFILDLHQVDGISECAARLLNEARVGFSLEGIAVDFSRIHGRKSITQPMRRVWTKGDRGYLSFEDNDLVVEWCENRLFDEAVLSPASFPSLVNFSLFQGMPLALTQQVEAATSLHVFSAGDEIVTAGHAGDGRVFFIESGQVSVLVRLADGAHHRITSLGAGMNFGEMVLLGQTMRSATVCADTEVRCRVLESRKLDELAAEFPQLKIVLLENLAKDMAKSLRRATQWIAALA